MEIRTGERINVTLPLTQPDPPFFGRAMLRHRIFDHSPEVLDDVIDNLYPQASTQWDGLRHRRDRNLGYSGGIKAFEGEAAHRLGVDAWAEAA